MADWLVVILVAVSAGVAGLATATLTGLKAVVVSYFERWRKRVNGDSYSCGLVRIAEFTDLLKQLQGVEAVDRVMVFVGQNGGGLPTPGKDYTVRAIHGWSAKGDGDDLYRRYNFDLRVDPSYCRMLAEMGERGSVVNTVEAMPDGTILKTLYADEGVVEAVMYKLDCDGAQLTYLSVASYRSAFTPAQRAKIDLVVYRLRAVLSCPE
jgi:hypothetical protein